MFRHRKTAVSGFLGGCVHGNVPVVPNRIAALDSGLTEEMRARRSTLRRLILFLRYAYRWRAVCRRYSNSSAMQPFFDGRQKRLYHSPFLLWHMGSFAHRKEQLTDAKQNLERSQPNASTETVPASYGVGCRDASKSVAYFVRSDESSCK